MRKVKEIIPHYFFPNQSNNFRAKTLHHTSLIFYILSLIIFQLGIIIVRHTQPNILGYATDITVDKLLYLVNQKRSEVGLSPLTLSNELSTAATQKAADMFGKNYWAHISPTGVSPWQFIIDTGYNYLYAGENLAKSFNTSEEVVSAWMNSPTHRANLLKPEYTDIGMAVINGTLKGEETTLVVQQFGARASSAVEAEVSSSTLMIVPKSTVLDKRQSFLPITISKTVSLFLAEFLLLVLLIDSIYIWRYKPMRLTGHSLAHLIFFAALIGAMGATGIGAIL